MEKIIDKLEFASVKTLRKNLLVSSVTAIVISQLVKYSEGAIRFLAFTIPENNKLILNKLAWWIVLYFIVALGIRFYNEEFKKWYKKKATSLAYEPIYPPDAFEVEPTRSDERLNKLYDKNKIRFWLADKLVLVIDIILPFVLGVIALIMCWSF